MSAISELRKFLRDSETVEAIVFGAWGWGGNPTAGEQWELGYSEPDPPPVPFADRGRLLTLDEATPLMETWNFYGGYGAPDCYAVNIWTNERVIWVTQYDGATGLDSAPRNPIAHLPDMPGG